MTTLKTLMIGAMMLTASSNSMAGQKVVSLDVDSMTCMSCPYQLCLYLPE